MILEDPALHGAESNIDIQSFKFNSRDELVKTVQEFYTNKGYVLTVESSKDKYIYLKCDRGGQYRNTRGTRLTNRQKETTSHLIGCPFKISGKQGDDGLWTVKVKNCCHNHEASIDLSGHPLYRRLPPDAVKMVEQLTKSGIQPRQILSSMRQANPDLRVTPRSVYNAKAKFRKDNLGDRSMIQALFEELGEGGFKYNFEKDGEGRLTRVFFSHPRSVMLSQNFSDVFVMDCTYKTNKYKMPLLEIIGVTSFNTSFFSCFTFLERENEENYVWALKMFKRVLGPASQPSVVVTDREKALINALKIVFPTTKNILCVWHIEKNILSNCQKYFDTNGEWDIFLSFWTNLVYSECENVYENNWRDLVSTYKEKKNVIGYITKNWLPWREMFVGAWTERYMHFGNRATSRAEGAHSKLKQYLQVSVGNFKEVKDKICLAVENEFDQIKIRLESEIIRAPLNCNIPAFKNLIFRVSFFALNKIHEQYIKAKNGTLNPNCTGQFTTTMGLPCAHQMRDWKNIVISLDQVHTHWRIDNRQWDNSNTQDDDDNGIIEVLNNLKYQEWPIAKQDMIKRKITELSNEPEVLFEPVTRPHKGRAKKLKGKGLNSTRRNPSQFGYVEAALRHNSGRTSQNNNGLGFEQGSSNNVIETNIPSFIDLNSSPDFNFLW